MATKRAASATTKSTPVKKAPVKNSESASPATTPATKSAVKKAPAAKKAAPAKAAPAAAAPAKAAPAKAAEPKSAAEKAAAVKTSLKQEPPAKKAVPYDKTFLNAQVKLLNEERATLLTQAIALKAEADALALDREPGDVQFDDESGEGDTLAVERDFDLARAAAAMHTVEEIDAALERVKKGTYGICEYSGERIPKERLEAIPYARERVEYKTRSFR